MQKQSKLTSFEAIAKRIFEATPKQEPVFEIDGLKVYSDGDILRIENPFDNGNLRPLEKGEYDMGNGQWVVVGHSGKIEGRGSY